MPETIKLDYPFTYQGREISELQMRRPKVRDRRLASRKATDAEREIELVAMLTEQAPEALDEMDAADYEKLTDKLASFFASSPATP